MKSTINEWLYKQLWKNKKRSMLKKIVYIIIPWFLLAILYSIIYVHGAGEVKGGYGFWQDKTNMFVLPYMFLFSYYVGGRNPSYLKESIISYFEKLRTDEDKKVCKKKINNIDLIKTIGHALAIIISIIGAGYFIYKASLNGDLNWYSKLNRWQMGYYSLFVFSTWYMSLNLLIDTVCTSIKVYKISIYKPEIQLDHLDRCGGIANVFTALSWNIGLAIYLLLSIILIFVSDFDAVKINIYNALAVHPQIGVIVIVAAIFYLTFTIIPFAECKLLISEQIRKESVNGLLTSEKLDNLKISMFNFKNIFLFVCSSVVYILNIISMIE